MWSSDFTLVKNENQPGVSGAAGLRFSAKKMARSQAKSSLGLL